MVESNLYHWEVKIFNTFNEDVPLSWELNLYKQKTGISYIRIHIKFGLQYPLAPPAVNVIEPRFRPFTSKYIKTGGSVSCDILNPKLDVWTPINTVDSIIQEFKTLLSMEGGASVFYDVCIPYSEVESQSEQYGLYKTLRAIVLSELQPEANESEVGGRIILPPSCLNIIVDSESVSFPILCEISTETMSRKIHCGVKDFDGPEHVIGIPTWLMENLQIESGSFVYVRAVELEKGTYACLQPTSEEFLDIDQPKEVLESILRAYPAMQSGQLMQIQYENVQYRFNVLETQPAKAIQLLNTDLEVDFDFSLIPNEAFESRKATAPIVEEDNQPLQTLEPDSDENTKCCENCNKRVPTHSYDVHHLFCSRNNILCDKCGQVVQKSSLDTHIDDYHRLVQCSCGESVEFYLLQHHKQDECSHRVVQCKYCHLKKKLVDMAEHELSCGTRTDKCEKCNQLVMIQDFEKHRELECSYPIPKKKSVISRLIGFLGLDTVQE